MTTPPLLLCFKWFETRKAFFEAMGMVPYRIGGQVCFRSSVTLCPASPWPSITQRSRVCTEQSRAEPKEWGVNEKCRYGLTLVMSERGRTLRSPVGAL